MAGGKDTKAPRTKAQVTEQAEQARTKLADAQKQAAELRSTEARQQAEAKAIDERANGVQEEAMDLRVQVRAAEASAKENRSLEGHANKAADDTLAEARKLELQAQRIQAKDPAKADDLRERVEELRADAQGFRAEAARVRSEAESADKDADHLTERYKAVMAERDQLWSKVKELRQGAEKTETLAEKAEADVKLYQGQLADLENELEVLEIGERAEEIIQEETAPPASSSLMPDQEDAVAMEAAAEEVLAEVEGAGIEEGQLVAAVDTAVTGSMAEAPTGDTGILEPGNPEQPTIPDEPSAPEQPPVDDILTPEAPADIPSEEPILPEEAPVAEELPTPDAPAEPMVEDLGEI